MCTLEPQDKHLSFTKHCVGLCRKQVWYPWGLEGGGSYPHGYDSWKYFLKALYIACLHDLSWKQFKSCPPNWRTKGSLPSPSPASLPASAAVECGTSLPHSPACPPPCGTSAPGSAPGCFLEQIDRQTGRQTDREGGSQTERQGNRQTDRQTQKLL